VPVVQDNFVNLVTESEKEHQDLHTKLSTRVPYSGTTDIHQISKSWTPVWWKTVHLCFYRWSHTVV